ncbi:MAG: hypothetical protein V3V00_00365, partial [Saprospiraceae bacterium]
IVWKDGKLKNVQEQLVDLRLDKEVKHIKQEEIHNRKSKTDHMFEYSKTVLTHQGHEFYYIKHELQTHQVGESKAKDKKRFVNTIIFQRKLPQSGIHTSIFTSRKWTC